MLLLSSGAISIFKFSSVKCSIFSGKRLIFDESSTLKVALAPHFEHDSSTLVEAESLGLEVQIGDPWRGISIPPELEEEVRRLENQTRFAVAVGLAKKNVE